jgi:hypothetical protein
LKLWRKKSVRKNCPMMKSSHFVDLSYKL